MHAIPVKRGCGTRSKGGIYAECGLSPGGTPGGTPLEAFLICPAQPLPDGMSVAPQGVQLFEIEGTTHVLDWVGSKYYPNVLDFVEEVRRFGLSRKIPKNLDISALDAKSRIILLHSRALLGNFEHIRTITDCSKMRHAIKYADNDAEWGHSYSPNEYCIGYWRHDIEGGDVLEEERDDGFIAVKRVMPSFEYTGYARQEFDDDDEAQLAIFAAFPISALVVVKDDDAHLDTLERVRESCPNFVVDEVDE